MCISRSSPGSYASPQRSVPRDAERDVISQKLSSARAGLYMMYVPTCSCRVQEFGMKLSAYVIRLE